HLLVLSTDAQASEYHLQFPLGHARRNRALGAGAFSRPFGDVGVTENSRPRQSARTQSRLRLVALRNAHLRKAGRGSFRRHAGFPQIADARDADRFVRGVRQDAASVSRQMFGRTGSSSFAAALYLIHTRGWRARAQAERQFARWPYLHFPKAHQRWLKPFIGYAEGEANGADIAKWVRENYDPHHFAQWLDANGYEGTYKEVFAKPQASRWQW